MFCCVRNNNQTKCCMNNLIPIHENNGNQTVSARELHNFLEATERFSYWIERQLQYGFLKDIDYVGCKEFNTLANQELIDFNKIQY